MSPVQAPVRPRETESPQSPTYTFASQPRALLTNRKKYRQPPPQDGNVGYGNIMFDRRIVRGSTFAQHPMPTDGESQAARQAEVRRRALARKRAQAQQGRAMRLRLCSPPPVPGRRHETVQTCTYLEEILDRPVEADACCQTDMFIERPETPPYIPAKTGQDKETQIYPGDLFDFDLEVEPILEVLVGKTMEQSMIEVLSEEEFEAMRAQQRRLVERRAGEMAEIRRLEERELRVREEKDRRVTQLAKKLQEQQEAEDRIAAALLTRGYLEDALPDVLRGLREEGYLVENIREDVLVNFMPWLMKEVRQEMNQMVASRQILSDLVREIMQNRAEITDALKDLHVQEEAEPSETVDEKSYVAEGDEEGAKLEEEAPVQEDEKKPESQQQ